MTLAVARSHQLLSISTWWLWGADTGAGTGTDTCRFQVLRSIYLTQPAKVSPLPTDSLRPCCRESWFAVVHANSPGQVSSEGD